MFNVVVPEPMMLANAEAVLGIVTINVLFDSNVRVKYPVSVLSVVINSPKDIVPLGTYFFTMVVVLLFPPLIVTVVTDFVTFIVTLLVTVV
jgi:hypothetical protein